MRNSFIVRAVAAILVAACGADRIVSLNGGLASRRVDARRGDLVDIYLWGGALGTYQSPPPSRLPWWNSWTFRSRPGAEAL